MDPHESDPNKARANWVWKTGKRTINGKQITVATMTTEGGKRILRVTVNRESVKIYERTTAAGNLGFQVANFSEGKRKLESLPTEAAALERAEAIARKLDGQQTEAATLTNREALTFTRANELLAPLGEPLEVAVARYVEAATLAGGSSRLIEAARFFAKRNPDSLPPKPVAEVAAELITLLESNEASPRYTQDLRYRLGLFADSFRVSIGTITAAEVQAWLDGMKLKPQTYKNFKTVLHRLFNHALARGYVFENPLVRVESRKVKSTGSVTTYSPAEVAKLLKASAAAFRPALAIAAFAGLRSAELVRMEWSDIDLVHRQITVGAATAKNRSRRLVPISPNLAEWLRPHAGSRGRLWPRAERKLYQRQQETAAAAGLHWRKNALRHSFISYRLAETQDAAKTSLEAGNSPQMVFRHYHDPKLSADAKAYFDIRPETPDNLLSLPTAKAS